MAYYKIEVRQVGTAEAIIEAMSEEHARDIAERLIEAQCLSCSIEQQGWDEETITAVGPVAEITVTEHAQASENAEAFDELEEPDPENVGCSYDHDHSKGGCEVHH